MQHKKLFSLIKYILKPHKRYLYASLLTGIIYGILAALIPYTLKLIIDTVTNYVNDPAQVLTAVMTPVALYIFLHTLEACNFRAIDWILLRLQPAIKRDITVYMFSYLKKHSYEYFQNNFAGSLWNKIKDMAESVSSIFQKVDQTVGSLCGLIFAMVVMSFVHVIFAVILFSWVIIFIAITAAFTPLIKNKSFITSTKATTLAGKVVDSIGNMSSVRLFARENSEISLIKNSVAEVVKNDRSMQMTVLIMRGLQDATIILLYVVMLWALIVLFQKREVTVGDFAFVLSVSASVFQFIWYLASQFVEFSEQVGKCSQALSVISTPHGIVDVPNAKDLIIKKGSLSFDQVTFSYHQKHRVFDKLSIELPAGTKTGIVGFSGSGKSTFVNLILRFFEVQSGRILIDEQDIAKVTQASLRQSIAMIPQDISLFHRSLLENIRYARPQATDEEIIEVSKRAHCHEFISQLPEGYSTLVGERGIKLSGGQRQRIAIARAMLKNAPILILDEATSALDSVTENLIQEGFESLMQSATTIVIAHRLSTLAKMDRILVFSKGRIVEEGTHQALLDANGHYAEMWKMQVSGFLLDEEDQEYEEEEIE